MTVLINRTMSVCMSRPGSRCVCPYVPAQAPGPRLCVRRPAVPPRSSPGRVEYGVRVLAVSCEPTPVDDRALA